MASSSSTGSLPEAGPWVQLLEELLQRVLPCCGVRRVTRARCTLACPLTGAC
jgi:hypothetical protein